MGNKNGPVIWADKKPTQDELKQIMADHKAWLDAGAEGEPPHDLIEADLSHLDFRGFVLNGLNLHDAILDYSDLSGTDLTRVNFAHADLYKADLCGANLRSVNLVAVDLRKAKLVNADLRGAVLLVADLNGADLRGADLSQADMGGVGYDYKTKVLGAKIEGVKGSAEFRDFARSMQRLERMCQTPAGNIIFYIWRTLANCGRSIKDWQRRFFLFCIAFTVCFTWLGRDAFQMQPSLGSFIDNADEFLLVLY